MKKLFAFLMVAAFSFAFVACGGASTETEATEETTEEVVEEPAAEEVVEEAPTEEVEADTTAAE